VFNHRHFDLKIRLDKEEKDKFKYITSRIHISPYKLFTRKKLLTGQQDKVLTIAKGTKNSII
jgi:hypothetical protein